MEATGYYWLPLYAHLRQDGQTIHVINSLQSDALRKLCRQLFFVVDRASDLKQKIIVLLYQIFPEYEELSSDTFGKSSVELLANYTTPKEMLAVDAQTLANLLNKTSQERFGLNKANQIQQFAKNSFGILLAYSSFSIIIRQYLEQLKSFESSIAIFDAEIARLMTGFNAKVETITGVGTTLAAVIFYEIGNDILSLVSQVNPKPMNIFLSAVRLICVVLCGLPPQLPPLKTLLLASFTRRNV